MSQVIIYYYRGHVERGTGEPGYAWHDGYSANSEDGNPTAPWSTKAECRAEAKSAGATARFDEGLTKPSE